MKLALDAVLVFLEKRIFNNQLWRVQFQWPNQPITFGKRIEVCWTRMHLNETVFVVSFKKALQYPPMK